MDRLRQDAVPATLLAGSASHAVRADSTLAGYWFSYSCAGHIGIVEVARHLGRPAMHDTWFGRADYWMAWV